MSDNTIAHDPRYDVAVLGAGPAGIVAATRASALGARTALVTRDRFGGMAANDGPVPVRTLAHAARLIRDARQLDRYGIAGVEPRLDYRRVLARVREVVHEVQSSSFLLDQITAQGVESIPNAGVVEFLDGRHVRTASGLVIEADQFVVCTGGVNKSLPVPGFELTSTHSDAWSLREVPSSMIIVGAGATGVQVASIFCAFGSHVTLLEVGPQILPAADHDIATAVTEGLRAAGVDVRVAFGAIECFEKSDGGVRVKYVKDGKPGSAEAPLVVAAVGWAADAGGLHLDRADVELTGRGFIAVDRYLRSTNPSIFAAGDITGRSLLASEAIRDGFIAADNAVSGPRIEVTDHLNPEGSFTDPEYASVGLSEVAAARAHNIRCITLDYRECTRPIIDGRTVGFCKLVVDADTAAVLGCHVVGDRAVDITTVASVALTAGVTRVDALAELAVSFPTYAEILVHTAVKAARAFGLATGPYAVRVI